MPIPDGSVASRVTLTFGTASAITGTAKTLTRAFHVALSQAKTRLRPTGELEDAMIEAFEEAMLLVENNRPFGKRRYPVYGFVNCFIELSYKDHS